MICSMFERADWQFDERGGIKNPKYKRESVDCLKSHITQLESYLHGSMIVNAFMWSGYSQMGYNLLVTDKKQVKNVLRRYLQFQLGIS